MSVKKGIEMNILDQERRASDVLGDKNKELTLRYTLNGGEDAFHLQQRMSALLDQDEIIREWKELFFLDREAALRRAVRVAGRLYHLQRTHRLSPSEFDVLQRQLAEDTPLTLQQWVFIPCLKALADADQVALWVPQAERYAMIGCYAQTELAHGSNVAALMTEAVYHPDTQEFDIHTPNTLATKWWVGQMGKLATHAVVFAQLRLPGEKESRGPHPFLVPLRSLVDHSPLPGVQVGDIGPKMGFAAVDNGFASFNHVRIPRRNMLARYSHVTEEGAYVQAPNQKLLYGSMLAVRAGLVRACARTMAAAATIVVRYSAVRRQFGDSGAPGVEKQIIDHQMQQFRVLPSLAYAYALTFTADWMEARFAQMNSEFSSGKFEMLAGMHATTSALKSYCTNTVGKLVEQCRLACGGHGYSAFSGIPAIYSTFTHMETAEGEAALLTQQVGRHLIKLAQMYLSTGTIRGCHPFDPAMEYFKSNPSDELNRKCGLNVASDQSFAAHVLPAFRHRVVRLLVNLLEKLQTHTATMSPAEAWNECHVDIFRVSSAHSAFTVLLTSVDAMQRLSSISNTVPDMHELLGTFLFLFQFKSGSVSDRLFVRL
jgi:acyl-CoA oxidase